MTHRPPGRPPGGGPPTRFTEQQTFAGPTSWLVREGDHFGEVAAAFAQQQLIARVRAIRGFDITAADIAEQLGRARTDRTVSNVWSGRGAMSLQMLLSIGLAFGIDPLAHCDPADLTSLLPEAHRSWLGSWRPGDGKPEFHSPASAGGEPAWHLAMLRMSAWVSAEAEAGTLHLATDAVATHATSTALIAAGLPAALATLVKGPQGLSALHYETQPEIEIHVTLLNEVSGPSRPRLLRVLLRLWEFRRSSEHRALVVLVTAPRETVRLEAVLPRYTDAEVGETIQVPPATLRTAGIPASSAASADFQMVAVAEAHTSNGYVAKVFELAKTPPTSLNLGVR